MLPRQSGGFAVVGLGQCSLDLLGLIEQFPEPDAKTELASPLLQGGGPVATALVTLARLGVTTAVAGRIGGDDFGSTIRAGLEAEGVDTRGLLVDASGSSQFACIAVQSGPGVRNIFWTRGSAAPLSAHEIPTADITRATLLHLDGLQLEASLAAAELARRQGVTTVLDGGTLRPGLEQLLPLIDHLVVSERFARQFSPGASFATAIKRLLAWGAKAAVITLGARGCVGRTPEGPLLHHPAFSVPVLVTTGCGDVFHGGYLFGLLQGWDLAERLRFASACAALKTRAMGGRTAIPRLAEVLAWLENHPQPVARAVTGDSGEFS